MQPLTHHNILTLIEPFSRRGRHADLAASDRLRRRLAFRPRAHAQPDGALSEALALENPFAGNFRLIRTLAYKTACGARLEARLVAEGGAPGALLDAVDAIAPWSQFSVGPGFAIARSYRLAGGDCVLAAAAAALPGLTVDFEAPAVKGYDSGDIALSSSAGEALDFPDDLLAVLGRDFGLLERCRAGWRASLRLRGGEPERSRRAARQFDQLVAHLARTLAEAPARFHERCAAARWRVALHRAAPLLLYAALICAGLAAATLNFRADTPLRLMIFNAAPVLVLLIFSLGKRPRIEIPPMPRRAAAPDWRAAPPVRRV